MKAGHDYTVLLERPQAELDQLWAMAEQIISKALEESRGNLPSDSECRSLGASLGPLAIAGGDHFHQLIITKISSIFGAHGRLNRLINIMDHHAHHAQGQAFGELKPQKQVRFTVEEEVFYENTRSHRSKRWHEIEVVKTAKGSFVLRKGYRSQYQGEKWYDRHYAAKTLEALSEHLSTLDDFERAALDELGLGYEIEEI